MSLRFPRPLLFALAASAATTLFLAHSASGQATPTLSFSAPRSIKVSSSPSQSTSVILAGDLNGDGNIDLVAAYGNPVANHVLLGDGMGGFTPAPGNSLAGWATAPGTPGFNMGFVDLNGDGKLDFWQIYPGSIDPRQCNDNSPTVLTVLMGDGKGGFGSVAQYNLDPADSVVSTYGDFNGDGKPDFAIYTYNNDGSNCGIEGPTVNILLNNGNGTFAPSGRANAALMLTHRASTPLGPQSAATAPRSSTQVGFRGIVAGDFNGDGKTDLVVADDFQSQPGNLHLLYGDGKGGFVDGYNYTVDSYIDTMAAANLNGDRKMDLVLGLTAKNAPGAHPRIATLLAKQTTGFYWASATELPNPGVTGLDYPAIGALTNFNGDGKLDVMLTNSQFPGSGAYSVQMLVLLGEGGGKFAAPKSFAAGSNSNHLAGPTAVAPFKTGGLPNVFLINNAGSSSGSYLYYLANQSH